MIVTRFDYETRRIDAATLEDLARDLDEDGHDGWQVVHVDKVGETPAGHTQYAVLVMRQVAP